MTPSEPATAVPSVAGPSAARPSATRWSLADRRDFLRRSLEDAEREHQAGDLDDADYEALRRRDEASLAEVEAALDALDTLDAGAGEGGTGDAGAGEGAAVRAPGGEPAGDGAPAARAARAGTPRRGLHRPRRRAWFAVVGVLAVAAGAVVLVVALTSQRLPGQVATGDVKLTEAKQLDQDLDQAAVLVNEGNVASALAVYQEVLTAAPHQSTALAESGWLEWESGSEAGNTSLEAKGRRAVAEAVRVDPGFYAGPLYLGTIDLDRGDAATAVAEFRRFLADHPPASWEKDYAAELREAFTRAGQPVPAGVPAAPASTSTTQPSTSTTQPGSSPG